MSGEMIGGAEEVVHEDFTMLEVHLYRRVKWKV